MFLQDDFANSLSVVLFQVIFIYHIIKDKIFEMKKESNTLDIKGAPSQSFEIFWPCTELPLN